MTRASCVRDKNHDNRPRVSCTSMGLSNVPSAIELTTQVLNFTDNQFISLLWTSFKDFSELYELDLSLNQVSTLEQSSEFLLPKLKILQLSSNQLEVLQPNAFAAAAGLMEIHLQANKLHTLNAATFSGLTQLEILVLSQNYIQALPPQLLSLIPSTALKTFDVEDNHLTVLPNQFFDSKPGIPYVYLSKNRWHCSCKVSYLSAWLNSEVENVYIREGPNIVNDPESVKCYSPSKLHDQPIIDLKEEDLCSPLTEASTQSPHIFGPRGDFLHVSPLSTGSYRKSNMWTTDTSTAGLTALNTIPNSAMAPSVPWSHTSSSHIFYETVTQLYTWFFFNSSTTHLNYSKTTKELWYSWFFYGTNSTTTREVQYEPVTGRWSTWVYDAITGTDLTETSSSTPSTSPSFSATTALSTLRDPSAGSPTFSAGLQYEIKLRDSREGGQPLGVYCWWLFLGYLCLCIFLGLWLCVAFLWLLHGHLRIYLPLLRSTRAQRKQLRVYQTISETPAEESGEGKEKNTPNRTGAISLPAGGAQAVFRSVLLVSVADDGEDGRGAMRSTEIGQVDSRAASQNVTTCKETEHAVFKSQRGTEVWEEGGATEDEVFQKTLYRVISQEGQTPGWTEIQDSWKQSTREHEKKQSKEWKKRYSLILREEKVEEEQAEKTDEGRRMSESRAEHAGNEWVVGKWEWKAQEGEQGAVATGVDDHWSLMPLVARGARLPPANSDSTSETFL
ncbi:platelet glycoprotein Ib alpha chain-like [Scleropages formosus]|uniref:Platelet glycoprotein Ib alpha chain-like n=2 Tax=Scleropages formosus TaxID=113540 RepID=A0A0P7UFP8_SCLFO|nr:platelet glycoprotein Ib alpha chain-like isoform X2 [Scleropages formosus]KPP57986.1 platelet glycoprotein Ib alpha chain-like [Scleropages formosus]